MLHGVVCIAEHAAVTQILCITGAVKSSAVSPIERVTPRPHGPLIPPASRSGKNIPGAWDPFPLLGLLAELAAEYLLIFKLSVLAFGAD
jgi:hypothetical protein